MCYICATLVVVDRIGIRELRQNASRVIEAAEKGTTYRVTNHGKDTGVTISRQSGTGSAEHSGVTPAHIAKSGIYDQPKPPGYEGALLDLVEHGRDQAGRVGE